MNESEIKQEAVIRLFLQNESVRSIQSTLKMSSNTITHIIRQYKTIEKILIPLKAG
jgi:transposase